MKRLPTGLPTRDTGTILNQAGQLLDFTKPVAVTLLAVLHVIPDADDPHAIVAKLTDALPAVTLLSQQVSSMITEYLRTYETQNFRNKQNFHNHGATRDNRWTLVGTPNGSGARRLLIASVGVCGNRWSLARKGDSCVPVDVVAV